MGPVSPESFMKIWTEWEISAMILLSLVIQGILVLVGNKRNYLTKMWIKFLLWLAYLLADWIAVVALGVILHSIDDDKNPGYIIRAFWASILLLHLGGPDTITAYSLEDSELWWRNFVVLTGQVLVSLYILLNAWSNSWLNFLSVPMIVAGIIKLGQRIMVLQSTSSGSFRKSMFPSPDSGPNYARFMDDYSSKKAEGFKVSVTSIDDVAKVGHNLSTVPANNIILDAENLHDAYTFFQIFKLLFADLILNIHDIVNSRSFFQNRPCEEVFKVIEIELRFMYDVFFTKAVAIYSAVGVFLRLVSFSCIVSVFGFFSIAEKRPYSNAQVMSTYVLLIGAVFLEIYTIVLALCSDRTMFWLSKHKNIAVDLLYKATSSISRFSLFKNKRWSDSIGQYNLIRLCLKDKPGKLSFYQDIIRIYDELLYEMLYNYKRISIPKGLKEEIFQQLLKKSMSAKELRDCKELCGHRGEWVLEREKCDCKLGWSVKGEFDESILLWHIATYLCYNSDLDGNSNDSQLNQNSNSVRGPDSKELSKLLSEYMLYILVVRPFMLPNVIGQIRFQDTCAEAREFFGERKSIADGKKAACRALLKVSTEVLPSMVKGDRSKSVLFDACRLAKELQSLETERNWDKEKKWEMISHVWVEILSYAASQCPRNQHAQQLRRGGELLTHVWLLMAHLGITKQFQITDGHARTKLIVQ